MSNFILYSVLIHHSSQGDLNLFDIYLNLTKGAIYITLGLTYITTGRCRWWSLSSSDSLSPSLFTQVPVQSRRMLSLHNSRNDCQGCSSHASSLIVIATLAWAGREGEGSYGGSGRSLYLPGLVSLSIEAGSTKMGPIIKVDLLPWGWGNSTCPHPHQEIVTISHNMCVSQSAPS